MTLNDRARCAERLSLDPFIYRNLAARERAVAMRDLSQGVVRFFRAL